MTLDQVVAVFDRLDHPQAVTASPQGSLETIARMTVELPTNKKLREVERSVLTHALATTDGNVSAAARLLGLERKALERKLARHGIR
jgi:DNA-binding NtrC family response regulator